MAALFHSVVAFIVAISISSLTTDTKGSIVLDLIHRDSPLSPLHNPLETNFDRLRNAFNRSQLRLKQFKHVSFRKEALQFGMIQSNGEYYMRISVGSPPVQVLAIADTSSDLTWVQCQPCQECYKHDGPIYDPRKSSTYHDLLCSTDSCYLLGLRRVPCGQGPNDTCQYSSWNGDGSFTKGKLATEKITLIGSSPNGTTSSTGLPRDIVFGCRTNNGGTFGANGYGTVVGLGVGGLSLVSQLGNETGRQFSYCLVPTSEESKNITSKIKFGRDSVVSGQGAVSTPLVFKYPDTYYYLTLEAISVGNKRLANNNTWDGRIEEGNIVIDSGMTFTYLRPDLFDKVLGAVLEAVDPKHASDPRGDLACFRVTNDSELPVITAHFTGADVELKPLNAFPTAEDGLRCLAIDPTIGVAIFGNTAQMNYEVGYDLDKRVVSFLAADCAKLL